MNWLLQFLHVAVGAIAVFLVFSLSAKAQVKETPADILVFGLKAYQDEFFEPAADALGRYLRLRPGGEKDATVRFLYAEALRKSKKTKEAAKAYERFIQRHPEDKRVQESRFRMAELLESLGDSSNAIRHYQLIKEPKLRVEATFRVAKYYLSRKKWQEASSALEQFLLLAPNEPRAESAVYERAAALDRLRQYERSESAYQAALKRFPKSDRALGAMRRLAFLQLRLERYSDAEGSLKAFLNRSPKEKSKPDIQLAMAISLYGQKKFEEAANAFERLLSLDLSDEDRRKGERGAADSWWNDRNFQRAVPAYRRLIKNSSGGMADFVRYLQSLSQSGRCRAEGKDDLGFALIVLKSKNSLESRERLLLANCLLKAGMSSEAVSQFKSVVSVSPNGPLGIAASLRLAEIDESSGRHEEASIRFQDLVRSAVRLSDSEKKSYSELLNGVFLGGLRSASFYFERRDCAKAVEVAQMIPRDSIPSKARSEVASLLGECAYRKGQLNEAKLQFGRVLVSGRRPELAARARLRLASIAKAQGDHSEALRLFREALPFLPEEMRREARLDAWQLLREMGKFEEGRKMILPFAVDEKADAERKRSVWMVLAQDAAAAGNWTEADEALTSWEKLNPPNPREGLILWTTVHYQSGRCSMAVETGRRALKGKRSHPARESLLRMVGSCLLASEKYQEVIPIFRELSKHRPEDAQVAYELAQLLERIGRTEDARAAYGGFIQKFPNHLRTAEVALRLGYLELNQGKREKAMNVFQLAVRSSRPEISEPARYQIALEMEARGEVNDALEEYEKLLGPKLGDSKWRRAAAWRAAGLREKNEDWEVALKYYRQLAKIPLSAGKNSGDLKKEVRQATVRAQKLEDYLEAVRIREEKVRNQKPLFR